MLWFSFGGYKDGQNETVQKEWFGDKAVTLCNWLKHVINSQSQLRNFQQEAAEEFQNIQQQTIVSVVSL